VFIDVLISENWNTYCTTVCEARDKTRETMQNQGYLLFPHVVERSDLYVNSRSEFVQKFLNDQKKKIATSSTNGHAAIVIPAALTSPTTTVAVATTTKTSTTERWSKFQHYLPENQSTADPKAAAQLCGNIPRFAPFWDQNLAGRSRQDEDKTVYYTFFSNLNRTEMTDFHYVELGAFDGVRESNTRFFDVCLGWEGLLIEPNPRVFPKLVQNRPYAHRMSFAASCSEKDEAANKTVGFWTSVFTNAAQDSSVNRKAYADNSNSKKTEVPCGSLTPVLLDVFPSRRVHFFSLDTEGTEHNILENIDFGQIFIDVLISENWNAFCQVECEARDKTRALMKAAGFKLYPKIIAKSDLYVHPQSEFAGMISAA
jgi:FkbM family methyltransferase